MFPMGDSRGSKGTKRHNLMRSAKNKKSGKFVRQANRTAANKARRIAGDFCKARRIERRRAAREV